MITESKNIIKDTATLSREITDSDNLIWTLSLELSESILQVPHLKAKAEQLLMSASFTDEQEHQEIEGQLSIEENK